MDKDSIELIGVWVLRITLLGGAIYGCAIGKPELTGGCITALICSFIFLG